MSLTHQWASSGVLALALLILAVASPAELYAQAPDRISYQGYLTAQSGRPLEGLHAITFKIFDGADPAASGMIWEQPAVMVPVADGIFNLVLPTDFNGNGIIDDIVGDPEVPFDRSTFDDGSQRFLELTIGSETLTPRQMITSVPFAMTSSGVTARTDILVLAKLLTVQLVAGESCADIEFVVNDDTAGAVTVQPESPFTFTAPIAGFYRVSALLALRPPGGWRSTDAGSLELRRPDDSLIRVLAADAAFSDGPNPRTAAHALYLSGSTLIELAADEGMKVAICSGFVDNDARLGGIPEQNWLTIEYVRSR